MPAQDLLFNSLWAPMPLVRLSPTHHLLRCACNLSRHNLSLLVLLRALVLSIALLRALALLPHPLSLSLSLARARALPGLCLVIGPTAADDGRPELAVLDPW